MVAQSLFLCLLFAALAGILTISGKAVVVDVARRQKRNEVITKKQKIVMMFLFVLLMALANVCVIVAPWFGPVSIYWPSYIACQLVFNMFIIGFLMGHEQFDKHAQVATMVVVTAVLFITINGPEPQDDQDIQMLVLGNIYALIWLSSLTAIYLICLFLMLFASSTLSQRSPALLELCYLLIVTCSSALTATTSKASSTLDGSEGPYRTLLVTVTGIIIVFWTYTSFQEAAHVRSLARYIPQVTLGSIIFNALTGLVVWEDYKVVTSWPGYMTALCLLGMGVYLISDLDFFKAQVQEEQYFHRQVLQLSTFVSDVERDLSRARLERSLSRHQVTITRKSSILGLTRGNSDPELGAKTGSHDFACDGSKQLTMTTLSTSSSLPQSFLTESRSSSVGDKSPICTTRPSLVGVKSPIHTTKTRPSLGDKSPGRTLSHQSRRDRNADFESIDALTKSFRNLKDLMGNMSQSQSRDNDGYNSSNQDTDTESGITTLDAAPSDIILSPVVVNGPDKSSVSSSVGCTIGDATGNGTSSFSLLTSSPKLSRVKRPSLLRKLKSISSFRGLQDDYNFDHANESVNKEEEHDEDGDDIREKRSSLLWKLESISSFPCLQEDHNADNANESVNKEKEEEEDYTVYEV